MNKEQFVTKLKQLDISGKSTIRSFNDFRRRDRGRYVYSLRNNKLCRVGGYSNNFNRRACQSGKAFQDGINKIKIKKEITAGYFLFFSLC